jgi:radical SAM protein with 4Fe4S-binding SPASM domain
VEIAMNLSLYDLVLELTNDCALRCIHCYCAGAQEKVFLPYETIESIINQSYELGVLRLTFTGGEALYHPNICEILDYAKKKGFYINILSSLYKVENSSICSVMKNCNELGVSVYGATAEIHEAITGVSGSFDDTLKRISQLQDSNIRITANITILEQNMNHINGIIELATKLEINYRLNFRIFNNIHSAVRCNATANRDVLIRNLAVKWNSILQTQKQYNIMCIAGLRKLWVDTSLDVYPCIFFRKRVGNLATSSLKDIYLNSEYLSYLKNISDNDFLHCKNCNYRSCCHPCVGENYSEHQDITVPSKYNCYVGEIFYESVKHKATV